MLDYRSSIRDKVSNAMDVITKVEKDMRMLQEDVSNFLPFGEHIPIDAQIHSITRGVEKIKESRELMQKNLKEAGEGLLALGPA